MDQGRSSRQRAAAPAVNSPGTRVVNTPPATAAIPRRRNQPAATPREPAVVVLAGAASWVNGAAGALPAGAVAGRVGSDRVGVAGEGGREVAFPSPAGGLSLIHI